MTTSHVWRGITIAAALAVSTLAYAGDDRSNVLLMKGSDMIGMSVQNPAGDRLGSIDDLAIQSNNGHCRYVILAHGGALGVGAKHYAVPFKVCKFSPGAEACLLDVTPQRLESAPVFDPSGWNTIGDERWGSTVYTFYNIKPDFTVEKTTVKTTTVGAPSFLKGSEVIGMDLHNRQDEDLGEIEDLMIDVNSGRCAYSVIGFGGVAGIGEKLFAVPWQALSFDQTGKKFVLDADKNKLKDAPGFDKDNWPDMADLKWSKDVHTFYGADPNWVYGYREPNGKNAGGWAATDEYGRNFKKDSVQNVKGVVTNVGSAAPMENMDEGPDLTMRTDKGETIVVHLGPSWFMDRQAEQFATSDRVEVTGCRIQLNGKPVIMAMEVKRGDDVLRLRDKSGWPVWTAWHSDED
ncbi:MAG: PRC-barrel domain-containing protein [Phycisphaerales bacterium]|nr:PRC-barrel domain-containing protein [Phycisphaerales bacterium]MCI0630098.1 PRC-barrel domain-containing protein [Phycisphaerales bacterium]MCI0677224.1 PRC-barrel domain-containing protein [Phycisphaerales bacterium]